MNNLSRVLIFVQLLNKFDAVQEDLVFGSDNYPRIAYTTLSWTGNPSKTMYYPFLSPDINITPLIDSAGSGMWTMPVGMGCSLALQPKDNLGNKNVPHIAYFNNSNDKVYYAKWNPVTKVWGKENVDDSIRSNVSIVLDNQNNPILTYTKSNGDLRIATKINGKWNKQKVYDSRAIDDDDYASVSSAMAYGSNQIVITCATSGDDGNVMVIAEPGAFTPIRTEARTWTGY